MIQIPLGWSRTSDPKGIPTYYPCRGGVANCVTSGKRANTQQYVMELYPIICATRGRDKDTPSLRGPSTDNYTQRLEIGGGGYSNTLTSVAKDNYLLIPVPLCPPSSSE